MIPCWNILRNAMNENFMRPQHAKMWAVADTPEEAIRLIYAEPKLGRKPSEDRGDLNLQK